MAQLQQQERSWCKHYRLRILDAHKGDLSNIAIVSGHFNEFDAINFAYQEVDKLFQEHCNDEDGNNYFMNYMRLTARLRKDPQMVYIEYCLSNSYIPDLPSSAFKN